jgi:hypothetical protein
VKQFLSQPSTQVGVWATQVNGGLRTVQKLIATLVCSASPSIAFAQTNPQLPRKRTAAYSVFRGRGACELG